ncbi:hypothetical protein SLH46_15235 [Draconibacterium sp. IB214405]|uniref:hypothetical protein n=1 Tax=Draconibacterium sp. IB214405 TaxID=3097352 RepID=UPI002A0CF16C|nr:hypothetical protein [Draconibacterium sp. IB214405]MDX8340552.1 hypothetical protein [Draconibacterium sp. IB214405]
MRPITSTSGTDRDQNKSQDQLSMTSREITQITGEEHQHILRECDVLNDNYERLALLKIEQ